MPLLLLLFLSILPLGASPLHVEEEWKAISSPLIMGKNYENRLFILPLSGSVGDAKKFWSGDYWSMQKGNINYRWNGTKTFSYNSPSKEQLQIMSSSEIAKLSPTEKFDILNGRYYYPLKSEIKKLTSYQAYDWEGICHGWAPASMNHNEPRPKVLVNADGISIPFGSADIKALLSYFYAYPYLVTTTHQVGVRCDGFFSMGEDCTQDLNAGAFHLILTNRIGLEKKGFIADMDRNEQVWNHPIHSYNSWVLREGGSYNNSAPGTIRTVKMSTTITYADESVNTWLPLLGTSEQKNITQELTYILDINQRGEIIGGEWLSQVRPDFLWIKEKPVRFTGNYIRLADLLND